MSEIRDRILDAATRLYMREGTSTTLSAVADEAGVSRPTVYKYVGDRNAIAAALIDREIAVFFDRLREVLDSHESTHDRVIEGVVFSVAYARDHELFQRLLVVEPGVVLPVMTTEGAEIISQATAVFTPYLVEGLERGDIRPVDPQVTAEWITRIGISLILTPSETFRRDDERVLRALLDDAFEHALRRS